MRRVVMAFFVCLVITGLLAAPALAKSPLLLKHEAEMAAYDAKVTELAKAAVAARAKADQAAQRQKRIMNVVTFIPGPGWIIGFFASWYKAGEMAYTGDYIRAVRNGTAKPAGNETCRGLTYLFFKGLSTAPEGIAFYGVGRTLQLLDYDQLDPYSVWTAYGRPYILDAAVIGTKAAFGAMGAYANGAGLPFLGGWKHAPVNQAFLWMAAGGGGLNVVSGTASQALQGAKPFRKYYDQHRWWSGRQPLR